MTDRVVEAMRLLFTAKWNIPTAARHCGKSEDEVKDLFRLYCSLNPPNYNSPSLQLNLLGGEPTII
jgi:AraC-like DNA-binding protein